MLLGLLRLVDLLLLLLDLAFPPDSLLSLDLFLLLDLLLLLDLDLFLNLDLLLDCDFLGGLAAGEKLLDL